jgi:hypothetical protein
MSDSNFLDALKPGDKVAVKSRRLDAFGRNTGYRIYTVEKISAKRTKFSCQGSGDNISLDFDKHGGHRTGSGAWSTYLHMEPVTEETLTSIKRDTAVIKARVLASKLETALVKFHREENPDMFKVENFLEASEKLRLLLGID